MIELPESHTLARQMDERLHGRKIVRAIAGKSPHGFAFYNGDPADYGPALEGRTIGHTKAYGGIVTIELEDMRLTLNDGVTPRLLPEGKPEPKKHQFYMLFDNGEALTMGVQMYGGMLLYLRNPSQTNEYYAQAETKPSPLSDAFDEPYFLELYRSVPEKESVKAMLATHQRIPGLGNGVLQDILFRAGIHPATPVGALETNEVDILFKSVKDTLAAMTAQGGRDTEKDLFGNPGGYKTILSRLTFHNPCPICGSPIERKAYMGGNVYFCSLCQTLKGRG